MITTNQFKTLDDLYKFYNVKLFNNELSECIVNMSRHGGSYGFFAAERWKGEPGAENKVIHEISINPDFMNRTDKEWHSTLVHEMCHLWQQDNGKPSRRGYHNKEWAAKMEEVGLMASNTGQPGGNRVGQNMTHYVIMNGLFERVFESLEAADLESLRLKYKPNFAVEIVKPNNGDEEQDGDEGGEPTEPKAPKSGKKFKYTCSCGVNVWGKDGLKLKCCECDTEFTQVD